MESAPAHARYQARRCSFETWKVQIRRHASRGGRVNVGRSSTRALWCLGAAAGLATIFAFAGVVLVAPPPSSAQPIAAAPGPPGFAALVAKVKPAVVAVHVEKVARAQSAVEHGGHPDQNPANAALRRVTEH